MRRRERALLRGPGCTASRMYRRNRGFCRSQSPSTRSRRLQKVEGKVVLNIVFSSTGRITDIRVVNSLPFGLTEKAIAAAYKIKFVPAMKDGHPVSMYMEVQYNFNIH
jgi:TonB family protein